MSNSKNIKRNSKKVLNWKKVYEKSNHNHYSKITSIGGNASLKSNYMNFVTNHKWSLIIFLLLSIIILGYTFREKPLIILCSYGLIIGLFLLALYNCTYKINLTKSGFSLNINFTKTDISYDNLVNIFLSREKERIFFIPIYLYDLNIVYLEDEEVMEMSLPTIMLDKKHTLKFFENIETEVIKDEEEEIKQKEKIDKQRYIAIAIVASILFIICLIVSAIVYNIRA